MLMKRNTSNAHLQKERKGPTTFTHFKYYIGDDNYVISLGWSHTEKTWFQFHVNGFSFTFYKY